MGEIEEQGWTPAGGKDPIEAAAQAYLEGTDGNPSAALRMAVADVISLNQMAVLFGEGVSWGFLRRSRESLFGGDPA